MSGSVIKLESFASAPGSAAMFNAAALDEAYREGYADGRADERGQDMKSLIQQIRALTDEISDDDARRAALRGDAVQVLSPILGQLIDALVPTSDSAAGKGVDHGTGPTGTARHASRLPDRLQRRRPADGRTLHRRSRRREYRGRGARDRRDPVGIARRPGRVRPRPRGRRHSRADRRNQGE